MGYSSKKVRLFAAFFGALVVALLGALPASASGVIEAEVTVEKTSPLGIVRGIVRDNSGSPIADASVAVFFSGTTKLLKQVTSSKDGSFLARITPGKYTILAVASGFNPSYIFGVDVGRSTEVTYGFKLERAGSGNTLPEKRLDKNSSKWRIRAAQMQRAIYQNREDATPSADTNAAADLDDETERDESRTGRRSQTVVETYFAGSDSGPAGGINLATLVPVGEASSLVIAAQTGTGKRSPQRVEAGLKIDKIDAHQLRFNSSISRIGSSLTAGDTRSLGQVSFQAFDEWKVREGIILVYGVDYSRFFGASDDSSLSPRLGLQFDLNNKTRLRTALTTQTETRSWANSIDLEGQSIAFAEPVSMEDLAVVDGKARMNKTRRLEFGIERIIDNRSSIEANAFFDTTFGRGVGLNSIPFDSLAGDSFGDFVADQQGRSQGIRVVYSRRHSDVLSSAVGYSFGVGQKLSDDGLADPAGIFDNHFFNSFFAQVSADLKSGTSIRTIYRLSPRATVFAVDPFKGRLAIYDPGLSIFVTQSLPTLGLPFRAQAIVDARNIFDFQSGVTGEEGTISLTSHRRMFRGGIQVRF
jgi:hypothetical protein